MSEEQSFAAGLLGIVLDERYRLDAVLGEGGMGAVYRAHHLAMDRKVAVKLLKPHLTNDDTALQRFAREARSTMKVDSVHAVKVLDFGVTPQKDYYMVLEYLDGRTVQRELDVDGPFTPARTVHIAKQALRAIGAAHDKGLIHRDIKPDNILLMRVEVDPDFAKVLDFGVAKLMDGAGNTDRSQLAITQAGMVFGTPEFMSPEQACGQPLDPRSDLYSLAATMFAMATGCGMYKAKSAIEWLTHHARTPPPHLVDGAPELAPYTALDQCLQRCLAKRRDDRPRNAAEMMQMLEAVEPTLGGGPRAVAETSAASTARGKNMRVSPSTFIPALAGEPDPNATLVPPTPMGTSIPGTPRPALRAPSQPSLQQPSLQQPSLQQPSFARSLTPGDGEALPTTTGLQASVSSRRGLWLAIGALAVASMIVAAIVVATKRKSGNSGPASAKGSERMVGAIGDATLADTPAVVAVAIDAGVTIDAAPSETGSAVSAGSAGKPVPRGNAEAAALLAEAEAAQRAGNRLRQIVKAAAALRSDPRNVKAKLILADGLIADGDLDQGCKYLRELGRNPTARAKATKAGCPTN